MDDERFSGLFNHAARVDFLLTDLDVALAFMEVAATTRIKETARRNHLNARNAYDTVLYLLRNLKPNADQQNAINQKLADLKAQLQAVGMF
jgi:hypothetical protein